MLILLTTLFIAGTAVTEPPSASQGACPAETRFSRQRVHALLSQDYLQPFRDQHGFGEVRASELRLLSGERDAEACRRLRAAIRTEEAVDRSTGLPLKATFYQADGFYFVALARDLPAPAQGRLRPDGGSWLMVLDSEFREVARASG